MRARSPRIRWFVAATAAALVTAAAPAHSAVLYGANGGNAVSDLFTLDPTTGTPTSVGPIGFAITGLAVHPTTRVLYGMTSSNSPNADETLITIDPVTGAGTIVGDTGLGNAPADIAFAVDGTLYGWSEASDDLVTIDLVTGAATIIADSELDTAGSGLAFSADGTLYFANVTTLQIINPATGLLVSTVGAITPLTHSIVAALAFHPATEVLFGVDKANTGGGGSAARLVTIDTATGGVTDVGASSAQLDGVAFAPLCSDAEIDSPWEECDDGNTVDNDGCSADCIVEFCGDTITQASEECDDGNTADNDGCSASCAVEFCGDTITQASEECDDGNTVSGDGCTAACDQIELCLDVPAVDCVTAASASLTVTETKPGNEKLTAKLSKLGAAVLQADFGDPVAGATRVDLCVYGPGNALVGELSVDQSGGLCGPKQKPCWKAVSTKGFAYKDPDASASGVASIKEKGGDAGKGSVQVQARNKASKGQAELPTGIAAALNGANTARVQVVTSDGACFDATLPNVKKADGTQFKAKAP